MKKKSFIKLDWHHPIDVKIDRIGEFTGTFLKGIQLAGIKDDAFRMCEQWKNQENRWFDRNPRLKISFNQHFTIQPLRNSKLKFNQDSNERTIREKSSLKKQWSDRLAQYYQEKHEFRDLKRIRYGQKDHRDFLKINQLIRNQE